MNYQTYIFLLEICSFPFAAAICPSPIVEDGGVDYHTQERFDRVRKEKNTFTAKFVHHRHKSDERYDVYEYVLNFCGRMNATAVLQTDKDGKTKIIGKIDGASVLIGADDWILVQYFHGDTFHENVHCDGKMRQAWVFIRCEDQGEKSELKLIEEARYSSGKRHKDSICYILFEYNHPAVCSPRQKNIKSMSGGAIFCIILVVLISLYFVFGFAYQRFIAGAKGFEQIPHYSFWRKFGNTMADGCDFVCRREERSNTYKGMADTLDIDSSDDDKDGLLPM